MICTVRRGLDIVAFLLLTTGAVAQETGKEKTRPVATDSSKSAIPQAPPKADLPGLVRELDIRAVGKKPLAQFNIENILVFFLPSARDPQKGELAITIFSKDRFSLDIAVPMAGALPADSLKKLVEHAVINRMAPYHLLFRPEIAIDSFAKIDTLLLQSQRLQKDSKARQVFGIQEKVVERIYAGSVSSAPVLLTFIDQPLNLRQTMFELNAYWPGRGDLWVHHLLKAFAALPIMVSTSILKAFSGIGEQYSEEKVNFYFDHPDYRPLFILFNRFAKSKINAALKAQNPNLAAAAKSDSLDQNLFSKILSFLPNSPNANKLDYPYPPASKTYSLSSQYEICSPGLALTDVIKTFNSFDQVPAKLSQRFFDPNFRVTQFNSSQVVARLLLLDPAAGARVSLSEASNSPINISTIARDHPNWVSVVAGAYTSPDGKIASLAYREGKLVSSLIRFNDGLVLMSPQGRGLIASAKNLRLIDVFRALNLGLPKAGNNAAETRRLFDYLQIFDHHEDYLLLTRFIEAHRLTLIQGHLLVENHAIVVRPDQARASRRLLLQFNDGALGLFLDLSPREDGMTLYEAAQIAADLNADYAFNLDTGDWDWGLLKIANNEISLGTPRTDHLTNVIVFDCHK